MKKIIILGIILLILVVGCSTHVSNPVEIKEISQKSVDKIQQESVEQETSQKSVEQEISQQITEREEDVKEGIPNVPNFPD